MSGSLGTVLKKLRKELKISQKELSRGVCSITTLSRIEADEREPDQRLFECLISRLGKDSRKWELILKEGDKKLLQKRNYMEYLLLNKEIEQLKKELEDYKNNMHVLGITKHLHEQYIDLIQGFLYEKNKNYKMAYDKCLEGLEKTDFHIDLWAFKIDVVLSKNELRLLYLLGRVLIKEEKEFIAQIYHFWMELLRYIIKYCTDEQYQLNFYIEAQYYLAYLAYQQQYYSDSIAYCQNAMKRLIHKKSIYYLKAFLNLIKQLNEKVEYPFEKLGITDKELVILLETLEEWEKENKNLQEKEKYIRSYNGIYSINEIIKYTRKSLRKTQEDILITNNDKQRGTQTAISEIESGKRTPRKEIRKGYLAKLGLQGKDESFQLAIKGDNFEVQELRWDIDFYIANHKLNEAEKLLSVLEEKLDLTDVYNEQYVREIKFFIRNEKELIPCDKWKEEVIDILSLTMKDSEKKLEEREGFCFFTQEELILLINLGCACHRNGEYQEALKYYEGLEQYFYDFYELSSAKIYKILLYNLSQVYGLIGNYEKAMTRSKISIFIENLYLETYNYYRAIYNIGWCYGKKMLEEKDCEKKAQYKKYCNKFFQQSFCMAKLYQDEIVLKSILDKKQIWKIEE